ncbi:hypothetical protein QJS10_CPB12g00266 [Acorus calamus]|uniref:Uncharacterized protein n=1 Tax=Acorus calamus TaxID=4465 RepID=A0AAV9DL89_ACOCL|nr:hypothetical protein QJS10_CPB12g00266 [Acorus calamus]
MSSKKRPLSPSPPHSGHSRKRPLSSGGPPSRAAAFPSYTDVPTLPPKIKLLCEIHTTTPSFTVESSLDDSGVRVTPEDVEENLLFDAMWDSVKSMRNERLLSLATFASVFGSYVSTGRTGEAILTFDQMSSVLVDA